MNKSIKRLIAMAISVGMIGTIVGCTSSENNEDTTTESNATAGYTSGIYTGTAMGNGGELEVEVTVAEGGVISGIEIVKHAETKALGDYAMEDIIDVIVETNSTNIEAISGATVSSNALKSAVKKALEQAGGTNDMFGDDELQVVPVAELEDEYTFDVIVIGAGGAGLSAAVEAAQNGAKVAVLEKTMFAGGNTLVSGGGLNIPGTEQQAAQGVEDSIELFFNDTMTGGDNENNPELVQVMADNALDAANWLVDDIGVVLMDRLQQFGGHSVPRAIIPDGNKGTEMIVKLQKTAEDLGVEFFVGTEGTNLIEADGAIQGVIAENNGKEVTFNAGKGVIIATGGFAADVDMRIEYNDNYDERFKTTAVPSSTGDGIRMAEEVGANLVDMEYIQTYPTCNPYTGIISYVANSRFDGAVLVNQEGDRFVNEMGRRDDISNAIIDQTDSIAYLVWGQEVESIGNMVEVHTNEYATMESQGLIYTVDTIEEAAEKFGIDPSVLAETINTFNGYVEAGEDTDYNKTGTLRTIAEGPFYIQKVTPATHHTMGGININTNAEVLDVNGEVIENLFAAGEVTGDIHGTNRLGGNAITDIVVFGRIAGENVVK